MELALNPGLELFIWWGQSKLAWVRQATRDPSDSQTLSVTVSVAVVFPPL